MDGCELGPDQVFITSHGNVLYNAVSSSIAGFQFHVDGARIEGYSGGEAGAAGFVSSVTSLSSLISLNVLSGTVIPVGCGTLIKLHLDGNPVGLSAIVVANTTGADLGFTYYTGATGIPAPEHLDNMFMWMCPIDAHCMLYFWT